MLIWAGVGYLFCRKTRRTCANGRFPCNRVSSSADLPPGTSYDINTCRTLADMRAVGSGRESARKQWCVEDAGGGSFFLDILLGLYGRGMSRWLIVPRRETGKREVSMHQPDKTF